MKFVFSENESQLPNWVYKLQAQVDDLSDNN